MIPAETANIILTVNDKVIWIEYVSTREAVFRYVMYPGDYIADSSVLSDFFPQEFDIFVFILVGNGKWYMEIEDC